MIKLTDFLLKFHINIKKKVFKQIHSELGGNLRIIPCGAARLDDDVFNEMLPYLDNVYGNASSLYALGKDSKNAIEVSREKVARALNSKPNEIYFTSRWN